jgi:hypothetical protein
VGNFDRRHQRQMPPSMPFPQPTPPALSGPRPPHPSDSQSPQSATDPDPRRDTRVGRPSVSTSDPKKRSRSSSNPPDSGHHDRNSRPRTSFSPVSASSSREWGQNSIRGSTTEVNIQVQSQGQILVDGRPVIQSPAKHSPRSRRNSDVQLPMLKSARMSTSSLVDSPVIPGVTTGSARRLRRDSHRRPKIKFYHRHEPHYGFTNFSPHTVVYERREYPTSEHLFQSLKVRRTRRQGSPTIF